MQLRLGNPTVQFFPFSGLEEEWKSFIASMQCAIHHTGEGPADTHGSPREDLKDLTISLPACTLTLP
jgi:hypothetical protein